MKKTLRIIAGLTLLAGISQAAELRWDGDAGSADWDEAANWSGDLVPTSIDNVTISALTGLKSWGGMMVGTDSVAADVIVDIPAWALRASRGGKTAKSLTINNMTFTGNFSNDGGSGITFNNGTNPTGLRLLFTDGNRSIINNSFNAVVFASGAKRGFGISGSVDGILNLTLEGAGDFSWKGGRIFKTVDRFGTGSGFTGSFTVLEGNKGVAVFQMSDNLCVQGGTINLGGFADLIDDGVHVTLNDLTGPRDATLDLSGVSDNVGNLNSLNSGGILVVDFATRIVFEDYNGGPVDITGFVEGGTVLQFDAVDGTESLAEMTINGGSASWSDVGGGIYQLSTQSAIPVSE